MARKKKSDASEGPSTAPGMSILNRINNAQERAARQIDRVFLKDGKAIYDKESARDHNVASNSAGVNQMVTSTILNHHGKSVTAHPFVVPFGIPQIDVHLQADQSGKMGLAKRMYIAGDRDIGKSTLAKRWAINALNAGGIVFFIDIDGQFDSGYFLSGIPGRLNKTGLDGYNEGRLRYNRIGSFHELYTLMRELVSEMKRVLLEHATANNVKVGSIVLTRDVIPVAVVIDGFSSLFTLVDADKDLDETQKTAGSNTDIHRMFKQLQTNLDVMGIPVVMTGHYRMKAAGQVYWREPAFLTTLQDYVQVVMSNKVLKKTMKTRDGSKVITSINTVWKFDKLKKAGTSDGQVGPIRFLPGRGYDLGYDALCVLSDAGYLIGDVDRDPLRAAYPSDLTICSESSTGETIPEPMYDFITEKIGYKKWINEMRADGGAKFRKFVVAVNDSLISLYPFLAGESLIDSDGDVEDEDVEPEDGDTVDDDVEQDSDAVALLKSGRKGFGNFRSANG